MRDQDGDEGGRRQGGARSRSSQPGTQSSARMIAHGGVEGEGVMMGAWLMKQGGQLTETELMEVETQVKLM